jgi:hypothetical protein
MRGNSPVRFQGEEAGETLPPYPSWSPERDRPQRSLSALTFGCGAKTVEEVYESVLGSIDAKSALDRSSLCQDLLFQC